MPNRNFWNRSVPRVEYDDRARDARLRLERLERTLVHRNVPAGLRYFALFRLMISNIAGGGRRRDQRTGSPNNRRPCDIATPWPAHLILIG